MSESVRSKQKTALEHLVVRDTILKAVEGMQKSLHEKKSKKSMLDTDFRYSLQVGVFKIPQGPGKLNKVLLPHSLIDDTDEVCLFVKDLQRGAKIDFEPTKDHFEEVLRVAGVTRINRVIPVNELKKNYGPFEAKLKLSQSFDVFLADSRIYNRILPLVGKHFLKRKKLPIVLKMDCDDLNESVTRALRYTIYRQSNLGNVLSIDVGVHKMSKEDITDNIEALVEQLKTQLPGGWENIKSIYLKPAKDEPISIPIYLNGGTGEDVAVPEVNSQKDVILTKKRKMVNDSLDNVGFTHDGKFTSKEKIPKLKA